MRVVIILVASLASFSLSLGQSYHRSSQDAAILSDARYLAGDGTFGAAYTQEDGVQFKEESDANGDRKGSYSYVDPTGNRRTVFYTAGKNGFQVRDELKATGDHIPTARPVVAPQPEYEPLPEYNPPDYRPPTPPPPQPQYRPRAAQPRSHYSQESIYQPQPEPRYYPRPQYHPPPPPPPPQYRPEPQPQYRPEPQPQYRPEPQPQYRPEPQPQYRPQTRPPYRPPLAFQPEPEHHQPSPPQFHYESRPRYQPEEPSPPPYRPQSASRPHYNDITTPAPRRFYPPGKLDFNRTPDGFSYTFSKN